MTEPAAAPARPSNKIIGSFDKGLAILDYLVHSDSPLRMQDVADHLGIDKSSALRFLATLEKHALVERSPRDKTYQVGPRLLLWSKNLKAGNVIVDVVRPYLKRLTALTQQTSHLAVLRDEQVVLVEVMPAESRVSVRQTPGDLEPLYCSAVGNAILAFLPLVEQRKLIERISFRPLTPKTIDSVEMLRVELRAVTQERVAFDEQETNPQISCIAAPLLDRMGYPVASIGISTVSALQPERLRARGPLVEAVRKIAGEATLALFKP